MQRIISRIYTISPAASKPEPADPAAGPAVIRVVEGVLTIPVQAASGSAPWVLIRVQTDVRVIGAPHYFFSSSQEIHVCGEIFLDGRNMGN